jgi:metal-responsive CopG/Arc/MetJ family transcriptional regulator
MAKRPGRPKLPDSQKKGVKVTVKLTPKVVKKLDKLAKSLGVSRSEVIRRLLERE